VELSHAADAVLLIARGASTPYEVAQQKAGRTSDFENGRAGMTNAALHFGASVPPRSYIYEVIAPTRLFVKLRQLVCPSGRRHVVREHAATPSVILERPITPIDKT